MKVKMDSNASECPRCAEKQPQEKYPLPVTVVGSFQTASFFLTVGFLPTIGFSLQHRFSTTPWGL
jgi:hypothetical protein